MPVKNRAVSRPPADPRLTFVVAAARRFPQWAVWLPRHGQWVAVRAMPGAPPGEHALLAWAHAPSASQLRQETQRAERRLRAGAMRRARTLAATGGQP